MPGILRAVVGEHAQEGARLAESRATLVCAPHMRLDTLRRFDDRLVAHIDGVVTGGSDGVLITLDVLKDFQYGGAFLLTIVALNSGMRESFDAVLALARDSNAIRFGTTAGLLWNDPARLRGVVAPLLRASHFADRWIGITVCAAHGIDPGLANALRDPARTVRICAFEAAGQLGVAESAADLRFASQNADDTELFFALRSLTLIGDRAAAREFAEKSLSDLANPVFQSGRRLAVQVMTTASWQQYLKRFHDQGANRRLLIDLCGITGDSSYVGWLIEEMRDAATARTAAEAFSNITGLDLPRAGMDALRPENFESGPNDDPNDPNVDMDPDDGLPWPDVKKIEAWWHSNEHRFQKGVRYFIGQPVTKEHCIHVLKTGYQRQRILAAQYLCLLEPGTPLFNTAAPAWRQQRLLAAM